ncbi:hypothetical protein AKJ16_DCAP02387 [Drosera capensis]
MSTSETTESAYLGVPGFVPGTLSATTLLSVYGLSSLFVVSIVWLFSGVRRGEGDEFFLVQDSFVCKDELDILFEVECFGNGTVWSELVVQPGLSLGQDLSLTGVKHEN